jgi:Predicted GTPase
VFVIDINAQNQLEVLLEELDQLGIKVNKQRRAISLEKTDKGGIEINSQISSETKREITELLNGIGIYNAKVSVPQGTDIDEIEDALFESNTYVKGIVALNKIDIAENGFEEEAKKIEEKHKMKVVPISAKEGTNIEALKQAIFEEVGLIRVYLQPKTGAEKVNAGEPMVVKRGSTVLEVAKKLNSKTAQALRFAYVTGKSVKFARQKVGREHVLEDEDVVTLVYDRHL